jgi:hypothetical protein
MAMKVERLVPAPDRQTRFAWSHHVTVPNEPGCYALVTYHGDVLYVGLATASIRNRMASHLDTQAKRDGSRLGVPFWFYYLVRPGLEVGSVERGWMNLAILEDGTMPPLNRVYSPL